MSITPELHDQFILRRGGGDGPDGWAARSLRGWTLASHPNLPVAALRDDAGDPTGWLLGWAIEDGRLLQGTANTPADFEPWLYRKGGRFAAVLLSGDQSRFYLDPAGTLAAVYSEHGPTVASTAAALRWADLDAYAARMTQQPTLEPNQFYPAGLTADPAIQRLLPNHFLDLDRLEPVRHWPPAPVSRRADDDPGIRDELRRIMARMSSNIAGIVAAHPAYIGLTAGRDSRMVLAAALESIHRIRFVTFMYEDEQRKADFHMARRIARTLGLDHAGVPLRDPTDKEKREYLLRTGWAGHWGKARDFDVACRRHLDLSRAWITGFGGEVGRAFYWRAGDDPARPPARGQLVERLNLPRDARTLEAWSAWQAAAPHKDAFDLMDLAYIEQRLGCWAGPHMYGAAPFRANVSAFVHRDVFAAMMALPTTFRRTQAMTDAILRLAWPELAVLPFQQLTGLRRLADVAMRQAHRAARAMTQGARRTAGRALRAVGARK